MDTESVDHIRDGMESQLQMRMYQLGSYAMSLVVVGGGFNPQGLSVAREDPPTPGALIYPPLWARLPYTHQGQH